MACVINNFPDILKGDSFTEKNITLLDINQSPINLTDVEIRCQFRKKIKTGELMKTIEIGSGITVSAPLTGVFVVDEFLVDWDADVYWYDFQFTYPSGRVITYFGGYIKVIQDVTQN